MKITFYSNFLNHHQLQFCKEMKELIGDGFTFVATEPITKERLNMGYRDMNREYPFVLRTYDGDKENNKAKQLAVESDVIIVGSAPNEFINIRKKENKLTFKYSERFFKKGIYRRFIPMTRKKIKNSFIKHVNSNFYVLCASAFTSYDLSLCGMRGNTFKWGYFPQVIEYDTKELMNKKNNSIPKILWVGRLLNLKRTKDAIEIVNRLKNDGYLFSLDIIGDGNCEKKLKQLVNKYKLSSYVNFLGSMSPERVREYMETANIFLFTSNFQEGWGAVLNEAMNSGCAIVASHSIGSVPFLIDHGNNGLIYEYGNNNDFYNKVKSLITEPEKRKYLGIEAYRTLSNTWNAKIASERLLNISKQLLEGQDLELYDSGPCSKAGIIKNNWIKK